MFLRLFIRITTLSTRCMTISGYVSIFFLIHTKVVEYKRKVYMDQQRDKSDSPVRHSISYGSREIKERTTKDLLSPNKNFMTHLPTTSHSVHASVDATAQYINGKMTSSRKKALRNANVFNITAPLFQGKSNRYSQSRITSSHTITANQEEDKKSRKFGQNTNLMNIVGDNTNCSSYTSQRTNPQFQMVEKAPIISTRKTHLTIDQRVWDYDQSEIAKINNSYPAELINSNTQHD